MSLMEKDRCSKCIQRAASIERVEMWKQEGARGIVSDPTPEAECKQHEGYGVVPAAVRYVCFKFTPTLQPLRV
jgi:hypothetical protein